MPRLEREQKTLEAMIAIYCRDLHAGHDGLCAPCAALLAYARARLDRCAFGERKPKCAACLVHCYKPSMRDEIRKVMRHAGPRMLTKHPVLALAHVIDGALNPPGRKAGAA